MTHNRLSELADRCEQATGPSRHLDTQIFILLDPDAQHIVGQKPGPWPREPIYGPRSTYWDWALDETTQPPEFASIPAYTASLDAAMTLVPEGHGFTLIKHNEGFSVARVTWPAKAVTPALALCAAALRSRSTETHNG